MERAVNSQTGEVLFLVNNQWMPPAQVAKNDKGDTAYLVNNQWEIVPGAAAPSGLASLAKPEPILSPEEQMAGAIGLAPQEAIPRLPGGQAEMRPYEPSLTDQLMELLPGNKYKAANEYAARQIAKERGVPVGEIYKDIGGARPMFNPEGRAPIRAGVEAGKIIGGETLKIPGGMASTALKTYRAGDIEAPEDAGMLDAAIAAMKPTDASGKPDPNYEAFQGLGESLGFSLSTMLASLAAAKVATVTAGPVAGVAAGMGASGAIAYRASKDDFLSRVRDKLNGESQKLYGTNISPEDWNKAKKEYNQAAIEYGAWEAIPEAVSNAVFLKAFAAPAKAGRGAAKIGSFLEKVGSQGVEQATETMTALGQNAAEKKAGLSDEEMTIADAFRQQFIQTLLIGGTMAGGMKGKQAADKFYKEVVEPRVRPGSALAKAIQADIDAVAFDPETNRKAAVEALNPNRAKEQVVAEPGLASLIQRPQIAMPPPPEEEAPPEEIKAPASSSQDMEAMLREVLGEPDPTISVKEVELTPNLQEPKAEKPLETVFTAPAGFAYSVTQSPAYGGADPLSVEDAEFELDTLLENAKRGRLTPQRFAESEIGRRLDTPQIMAINDGIRNNPIATIETLIQKVAPAKAPTTEAPKEPTLKEQYDKAAKLNLMAPDAFRDRRITQEQYDKIESDYERIKTEYQASIPKATLTPIQQEATDIADGLEELGQKSFVTGMRSAIARNQVNKDNLEFYRSRLKQEQAKQNALDEGIERPSEKFEWTNFFRDDPKDLEKLKLLNSKAPPAVKQALQTVTDTLQALTNRLNDEGYTMYGTPNSTVPQEIKNLRSQIQMRSAGGVKLINAFEALNKGFNRSKKTTNKENLDAAIQDIKVDAAEAQKVLQRSIPEPQEIVEARGTLAQAGKQIDTLTYKSGSLWSALVGKLDPEEVREIFGRDPSLGNKKLQVTKKSGKRGTYITELAADGLLDPFLPPAMRHQSSRFDAAESAQYIKDAVANKDYLPHDAKEEIKNIQESVEPFGDLIDEYLTIEEQNRELQIAFDEQREADQAAEIVEPEDEDRAAEPSERPAGEPLKQTVTLYHGTSSKYDKLDPSKGGGMVFFGEDQSVGERYAQNGGGGRARLDDTQKYIVEDGVVYELTGFKKVPKTFTSSGVALEYEEIEGGTWKAIGLTPEEGLINKGAIKPLDKKYPDLSLEEAQELTDPDSGSAGVVPKDSRIIEKNFTGLNLLDISTPEGRDVIAGLKPKTQIGRGLVEAAQFDARDKTDRNSTTQLNSNFWGATKYASVNGKQIQEDVVGPLKAMGYDGIRFQDDQHKSVGLFDVGLEKEKTTPPAELELTAPTKDELKSKQDEIDRLSKENERLSKEAERKAKADEEAKDFVLTGSKRDADQAAARGQKDIFAEEPTESKSLKAMRGDKFVPDALDKKAIAIYKQIKENNPNADVDEEIENPNHLHEVEEQPNSKGIKIGDLVYRKGNPVPEIAITVGEDSVKLIDQKTGNGLFTKIEGVSKEPISHDYNFDFGYGKIDVDVETFTSPTEWSVDMRGPGASKTGYRSALGVVFKGKRGTPEFDKFVEQVVRNNTKEMAEAAPADNKKEIADLRKEQKTLMLQIIKAGMQETPVQEARMAEIENRINELEGKPAKPVVKQRSVEEIEEDLQDLQDQIDGEILKEKRMPLIEKLSRLEGELTAAKGRAARAAAEAAPTKPKTKEAPLSLGYTKALDESREATKEFSKAQEAYRAQQIDDDEFLIARKKYDLAIAQFDRAFKQEQNKPAEPEVAEEVLPAVEEEAAGELGFEPYTIEGDFTEVAEEQQRLMLEDQTENLSDAQVSTLEKHYGAKVDSDEFFTKLREDVSNFIVKGATAVNGKIRAIIRKLANGVLAVGIAFNPQYMSQPLNVMMPIDNVRTEEVLAKVPDAATDKMSEPAKRAFAVIYPALQEQMVAKDKLFIMADKPSGRVFVFNPDGSLLLEKKSLFGLAKGDLYVGDNDKPQNRITPAGLFDLKFVDAQKGASEKRTAGDYDTGTVLAINDPDGTITIMHSVWLKEKDGAQRAAALRNESPADSRYSFGCINVDAPTYKFLVNNHAKQMDGAALFIVPEAGVDVMSFITGKGAMSEDLARIKVKPVTKEVRTPQRQATQAEAKTKTPGREQQFFSLEKQTNTPAFKKFFGNSKVVDANGEPLVVYHGTNEDFVEFNPYADKKTQGGESLRGTNAMFFTNSTELASAYTGVAKSVTTGDFFAYPRESAYGGNVMPVYLSLQNPMIVDAKGQLYNKVEPLIREAKKKGHDGVIFKNVRDQPGAAGSLQTLSHDAYVVFKKEQIKSAIGNRGTFDESGNINMSVEGKKLPPGRSPELAAAARQVKEGTMTAAEFDKLVNKYRPIRVYEEPLKPATRAEMVDALSSEKKDKVSPDIPEGTRVGLRLDIPAFNRKGVYVVTIHEKGNASGPGKAIGYDSVAVINNVTFGTGSQKKALNIATGEAKDALQTMEGEFVKSDPDAVYADALKAMDDPAWTQIGVDPTRHTYFFDRNTTQPVIAAEQVIQIGNTVLAKNVTYGRKEDFLYNLEDDLVKLVNNNTDSIDEAEKKRSPSFKRKAKVLTNQRNEGKLTDEEYLERMNAAIAEDEESRLGATRKNRVRGADFIREKLLNAKRNGFLSDEAVDLAEWFIGQNPDLVDDLGISIKAKGPSGAGGFYNPLARIITLIKERGSDLTTVHEILHHLERMMPAKIQAAIRKAWLTQLLKANKAATDPAQKLYFMALLDAHIGNNNHTRLEIPKGSEGIYKAIVEQMKFANELTGGRGADPKSSALARELLLYSPTVPSELYEYFDPSEFWAVNGSDIVRARYDAVKGGVLARLKNWLREFAEKVKSLFGMKSDASIIRALDSLAKSDGQFVTNEMLGTGDYQNIKKNAFGGEMPKATWAMKESSALDDMAQTWQDNFRDLKNIQKIITETIGKIDDRINAYRKQTVNAGREAERQGDFVKYEVDPLVKEMIAKKVSNKELATYLHNRYAEERNEIINAKNKSPTVQNKGSGISTENARKYMEALPANRAAILERLAKRIDKIVSGTQDLLVQSGQETQETIDGWRKSSPHYVPLARDESELDFIVQAGSGSLGGYATAGKFGKEAIGSTKTVVNILENVMLQRDRAIRRAESIRIGQALYGMAIQYPNPDFWMAINPDAVKDIDALIAEMKEMGLEPELIANILEQPKTGYVKKGTGPEGEDLREVRYRIDRAYQNAKNVFPVRINGQNRYVLFNPKSKEALRMAAELKQLNPEQLNLFFGVASSFSRWFAAVNTQYNPVFGLVNFWNDTQGALINLSTTPLAGQQMAVMKNVLPAMRGIARDIRKERKETVKAPIKTAYGKEIDSTDWSKLWRLYRNGGGKTAFRDQMVKPKLNVEWKGMMPSFSYTDSNTMLEALEGIEKGPISRKVEWWADAFSDFNDTLENTIRLSVFKVAYLDNNLPLEEAIEIAKNITVDFNRRGARTKNVRGMYVFFNAALQSNVRIAITLAGPAGKTIVKAGLAMGALNAFWMMLAGFDDDDPPQFTRNKGFIVPTGDGDYAVWNLPQGWRVIPNTGRLVTEGIFVSLGLTKSNKGMAGKLSDASGVVFDAINPFGGGTLFQTLAPTILDPALALAENKDSFGRPIFKADQSLKPTPGWQRTRESASTFSKGLAWLLNYASAGGEEFDKGFWSPTGDQIDYLISQAAGGFARDVKRTGEWAYNAATGEETPSYRRPVLSRFFGETKTDAAASARFYDNVTMLNGHLNVLNGRIENQGDVQGYLKKNPVAKLAFAAEDFENDVSSINRTVSDLQKMPETAERKKQIKDLKASKVELMKTLNNLVRQAQ